ncbi:MAG: hypothetical protein ACRDQ5_09640 [Sciscionella sp.]
MPALLPPLVLSLSLPYARAPADITTGGSLSPAARWWQRAGVKAPALADAGAAWVRSDTDVGNTPMRAAFARAGYRECARRWDYRWRRSP